jgi:hypothetical protein
MTTKPKTATEIYLSAEWFDVPRGGRGGRAPGHAHASILSNGKGDQALALRPDDETSAGMADWRFVTPRMRADNETGAIVEVALVKSERGLSIRRYKGTRPQVHILLTGLVVTAVDGDVGVTTCRIEGNAVVFALPPVIEGKHKSFKIARAR